MKAYTMVKIVEMQEAVPDEYAMYKELDLIICPECTHYEVSWDREPLREPCKRCVLSVSQFEEKDEAC